jgi:phosphatidylinositol-3-phosphatase
MSRHRILAALSPLVLLAALLAAGVSDASQSTPSVLPTAASLPAVGHLFVINLENKGFDETWGPGSQAPYLSRTLRSKGVLLTQYYGTAHNSLPNYIGQISGQGPNLQTQEDCQFYSQFAGAGTVPPQQYVGDGCVYPSSVPTIAGQLPSRGLTWKGYMQDMGTPCRHPALNTQDGTQKAKVGDQYAARHNPFVYFQSITKADCTARDVDLNRLPTDLASVSTTPNLSYITPNLCNDGHDAPCVDGRPGGLKSADLWLKAWVPKILASPAYKQDGALIITFDESDGPQSDSSACCGEGPGPNTPVPGLSGLGGGRVGALVISRFVQPGATSTHPYNHYSLLATMEDLAHVGRLGYAHQATRFGSDVFSRTS